MGVLAALACLVFILSAFARLDDDPLNHIISQLEKWASANPVEKVCLQSDKPYYAAGDWRRSPAIGSERCVECGID
jgi:hypothetical protein